MSPVAPPRPDRSDRVVEEGEPTPDLDPHASLDRSADLHQRFAQRCGARALELYVRETFRVRIEREDEVETGACGVETGTAVRLLSRDGSSVFASTSGAGAPAVAHAIDRALATAPTRLRPEAAPRRSQPMRDLAADLSVPTLPQAAAWIEAAQSMVAGRAVSAGSQQRDRFQVDAALTIESLCAPGGLLAVRARTRLWALWMRGARVRSLVARRLERLRPETWRPIERDGVGSTAAIGSPSLRTVALGEEAACALVRALAGVVHVPDRVGAPAGPGWRLADDPRDPEALVGGTFDDAGFDTARVVLGDGSRTIGSIGGPGHLWRPSFRDLPRAQPANLVVEPSGDMPADAVLAHRLTLHVLAPDRWVLALQEVSLHRDPGVRVPDFTIETRPEELIGRCVAAVGPAHRGTEGVLTPTLVFEDLAAFS